MNTALTPTALAGRRSEAVWANVALAAVLLVAAVAHSINMFGFPLYYGDEGIYMSQAYAVLRLGAITPYAYWYDHAPAGWLLIAVWTMLSGGFHTFGTAVNGGRVLMLLLHLASVALVFRVALRISNNTLVAAGAGLLLTLSPLSVIYGRMVLLDNIMIVWALLALALLLRNDGQIWQMIFSGVCLGVAVLTKETALVFMPAFAYGIWALANRDHARFARAGWIFAALSTISLYALYAALRKELIDFSFAPSPLAGGTGSNTLFGAILWQMGRSGGMPWDPNSDFFHVLTVDWLPRDPWILGLGLVASVANLFGRGHRRRVVALLSLLGAFTLLRGGVVLNFYIVALLPLLALNIALAADLVGRALQVPGAMGAALALAVAFCGVNLARQHDLFNDDVTAPQRQALAWVQQHVPANAQIVANDTIWVDLRDGARDQPSFAGTHSHWKVARDPAVHKGLFNDDWHNLDYLVMEPGMAQIFAASPNALTSQAYARSTPVAQFGTGANAVEVRKVDHPGIAVNAMLEQSYQTFRDRYIREGQVRGKDGYTDSRDQAAAMMMAVSMNDRATFDQLWQWAYRSLRADSGLLLGSNQPGAPQRSHTEADTDAAVALLLAERRWGDPAYGTAARSLIDAIWTHEVVEINGAPYVAAGDWAINKDRIIFAPAAFAPYAYHLFADADPGHNWWYLLDTNYKLLSAVSGAYLGESQSAGLPPAYVGIDREFGALLPNPEGAPTTGNEFNADAAKALWRVGLDAQWFDDERADTFLKSSRLLSNEWSSRGALAQSYGHDGTPGPAGESTALDAGALGAFLADDPRAANELFAQRLAARFTVRDGGAQWGENATPDEQRWAWYAAALYDGAIRYTFDDGR